MMPSKPPRIDERDPLTGSLISSQPLVSSVKAPPLTSATSNDGITNAFIPAPKGQVLASPCTASSNNGTIATSNTATTANQIPGNLSNYSSAGNVITSMKIPSTGGATGTVPSVLAAGVSSVPSKNLKNNGHSPNNSIMGNVYNPRLAQSQLKQTGNWSHEGRRTPPPHHSTPAPVPKDTGVSNLSRQGYLGPPPQYNAQPQPTPKDSDLMSTGNPRNRFNPNLDLSRGGSFIQPTANAPHPFMTGATGHAPPSTQRNQPENIPQGFAPSQVRQHSNGSEAPKINFAENRNMGIGAPRNGGTMDSNSLVSGPGPTNRNPYTASTWKSEQNANFPTNQVMQVPNQVMNGPTPMDIQRNINPQNDANTAPPISNGIANGAATKHTPVDIPIRRESMDNAHIMKSSSGLERQLPHQHTGDVAGGKPPIQTNSNMTHDMRFNVNPQPPPNQPMQDSYRGELKVKDALDYLDKVKLEFGDRPRIYNEFLDIMKNFKAHEIDTPGVIRRVSHLFRGYNNLILGFNTFLPDGFKIEKSHLVEMENAFAASEGIDSQTNVQSRHPPQQDYNQMNNRSYPPPPPPLMRPQHGQQQLQPHQPNQTRRPMVRQDPTNNPVGKIGPQMKGYNQSHNIPPHMPAQKMQQMQVPQSSMGVPSQSQQSHAVMSMQQQQQPPQPPHQQPHQQPSQPPHQQALPMTHQQPLQMTHQQPHQHPPQQTPQQPPQQQPQQPQQQHKLPSASSHLPNQPEQQGQPQAVEFDHAITYVTTIKKRFANEPRTYQQFLEILHTYQKEQRGIREVLEQVSSLFADHPDLLKEFTYFLPEAVQEQAKERLHAAAADAEARQAAATANAQMGFKLQQQQIKSQQGGFVAHHQRQALAQPTPTASVSSAERGAGPPNLNVGKGGTTSISPKLIDMTKKQQSEVDSDAQHGVSSSSQNSKRPHSPIQEVVPTSTKFSPMLQYPPQPESFVYNAGVERQFFDAAKEALTSYSRDGELAWAEFLKCMDLYAQEILSRSEMLGMIEDLLGKRNTELFEEFKRILTAAGAAGAPSHDDAWYSVPLSEIDFSRCRKCGPSYRALPRDYPSPPCSERCDEEQKVLNDVWVSLPVGSEESYTFRHMRKNQYEETLFRCEDERFEIDMVIDSNVATLRRLEPIGEEIALLQQKEIPSSFTDVEPIAGKKGKDRSAPKLKGGLGGKVFQYYFDDRILNTIHKHCISRIYGDSGPEMLKMISKNPAVAIPVVIKRLRQKDKEFREAREVLNRRWKELAELNYYKSLDHRSLTWRTTDKRATSTRTLMAEIKDRATHNGNEGEAALTARKEKAKEEHGSFYERTMGRFLSRKVDLTLLPKPNMVLFTPHLSIIYENNSWAQRDAYRILSFALERGTISPSDKERCHRVWRDFLAPFFGLSLMWMQSPAISYAASPPTSTPSIVSNEEESGNDDESSTEELNDIDGDIVVTEEIMKNRKEGNDLNLLDQQPIPPGTYVSTLYGEGRILKYRRLDKIYIVSLPYAAIAHLHPNALLCTIEVDKKSSLTRQLTSDDKESLDRGDDMLIMGPQSLYLFFRLHQVLIRRLNIARKLAYSVTNDISLSTLLERMSSEGCSDMGSRRYDAYISLVYGLVEGNYSSSSVNAAEGGKYEDRVRCLLGHGAYELATMDKLVSHILKNLQNMANDDMMQNMIQVFQRQREMGCFKPMAFRQEASIFSEGENMFAVQYCKVPKSDKTIMHMDFLGCITDSEEGGMSSEIENSIRTRSDPVGPKVDEKSDEPVTKRQRR